MKAVILGVTGYGGNQLLKILLGHPSIDEIIPVSSSRYGEKTSEVLKHLGGFGDNKMPELVLSVDEAAETSPEVVFSALPHLASAKVLEPFLGKSVVIDLSADFRIQDPELFLDSYGERPAREDLLPQAIYGLSEIYRKEIQDHSIIAVPGCYPTATLLPLIPVLKEIGINGVINTCAISGISGAGKKAKENLLFAERSENTGAYLPGKNHRHVNEILSQLQLAQSGCDLLFTPHLAPLIRGLTATTTVELQSAVTEREISSVYESYYGNAPFIGLRYSELPQTSDVRGSNRCDIGWYLQDTHLILFSAIDNLIKGAAGQAVQNMNIRFQLPEDTGLRRYGDF